jgi:mRNA interferase MazF
MKEGDVVLAPSGLITASLVRLGFLAVLPRRSVIGSIGAISSERYERLIKRLGQYLVEHVSS